MPSGLIFVVVVTQTTKMIAATIEERKLDCFSQISLLPLF